MWKRPIAFCKGSQLIRSSYRLFPHDLSHLQINCIRPSEANFVGCVTCAYLDIGVSGYDIVFFANRTVRGKARVHGGVEVLRNAGGIGAEAEGFKTGNDNPVGRRPSERFIPLQAGVGIAGRQAAGPLKKVELSLHLCSLIACGVAGPQRVERGDIGITRRPRMNKIKVGEYPILRTPEITVDGSSARLRTAIPMRCVLRVTQQKRQMLKIALIAIEQAVEADRRVVMRVSRKGAEAIGCIES